jgi:hypothetical protein
MGSERTKLPPLGIRWTVGDVSPAGFQALQLSIWGMWRLFGRDAQYAVCVNTIPVRVAMESTGEIPTEVRWIDATPLVPDWLWAHVSPEMAEGVAWKLAPVRSFPDCYELSLDNDVVLWALPAAVERWLMSGTLETCLLAADLTPALGQFATFCGDLALNSGIRGLPPGFDLETRLRNTLAQSGVRLQSELDEQGLQAATLLQMPLRLVSTDDISICSPFPNHQQHLGRCGAHFVGLNPKRLPWMLEGRSAHEVIREFWDSHKEDVGTLILASASVLSTSIVPLHEDRSEWPTGAQA